MKMSSTSQSVSDRLSARQSNWELLGSKMHHKLIVMFYFAKRFPELVAAKPPSTRRSDSD